MRETQPFGRSGVLICVGAREKDTAEIHHLPRFYLSQLTPKRAGLLDAPRAQRSARCGRTSLANISSERRDLAGSIPGSGVAMMKCVQAYWRLKALNLAIHSAGVPTIMCSA